VVVPPGLIASGIPSLRDVAGSPRPVAVGVLVSVHGPVEHVTRGGRTTLRSQVELMDGSGPGGRTAVACTLWGRSAAFAEGAHVLLGRAVAVWPVRSGPRGMWARDNARLAALGREPNRGGPLRRSLEAFRDAQLPDLTPRRAAGPDAAAGRSRAAVARGSAAGAWPGLVLQRAAGAPARLIALLGGPDPALRHGAETGAAARGGGAGGTSVVASTRDLASRGSAGPLVLAATLSRAVREDAGRRRSDRAAGVPPPPRCRLLLAPLQSPTDPVWLSCPLPLGAAAPLVGSAVLAGPLGAKVSASSSSSSSSSSPVGGAVVALRGFAAVELLATFSTAIGRARGPLSWPAVAALAVAAAPVTPPRDTARPDLDFPSLPGTPGRPRTPDADAGPRAVCLELCADPLPPSWAPDASSPSLVYRGARLAAAALSTGRTVTASTPRSGAEAFLRDLAAMAGQGPARGGRGGAACAIETAGCEVVACRVDPAVLSLALAVMPWLDQQGAAARAPLVAVMCRPAGLGSVVVAADRAGRRAVTTMRLA